MKAFPNITRTIKHIALDLIDRDERQPREQFNEEDIKKLALSIQKDGLIQLPVVREHPVVPGRFLLIAGERRTRALRMNEVRSHDFVVYEGELENSFILSAVENLHRVDLNPIEVARTLKRLHEEEHMTWKAVSELTGISVPTIHNKIKLLELPWEIQKMVTENRLPQGSARNLAQYRKGERGELIMRALDLIAGKDPLEMGLTPDTNRSDRHIDARLPNTPEAQLRRALRAVWYSRGAFRALKGFLDASDIDHLKVLGKLAPNTLNALRTAMLDLESITTKFNRLFVKMPKPEKTATATKIPTVTATKKITRAAPPATRQAAPEAPKPLKVSAEDLDRVKTILQIILPQPGVVDTRKQTLATKLGQPEESAERSALWALRVAEQYWRKPMAAKEDPESPFLQYIAELRTSLPNANVGLNPSLFHGFLGILKLHSDPPHSIDLNQYASASN